MALINTNNLKQYFLTGLKPTQQQFWNLIDSFRHKNDLVPASEVDGLQGLLDQKLDAELYVEGFNVVRVIQVEETTPNIVALGHVALQFNGSNITNLLFNTETSKYLVSLSEIINTSPVKLKLFNTTQKKTLIADVSAIATNQGQTKITLVSGALVSDVEEGDVLKFELDFKNINNPVAGGTSIISLNSRAELLSQTTGTYFYLKGGYDKGMFALYDGEEPANGGTIIELSDNRKVKRIYDEKDFNVDWFGTERTNTSIQQAIDYAKSKNLKRINFSPEGKYVLSIRNIVEYNYVSFIGNNATIEIENNSDYLFKVTNSKFVYFQDFILKGDNIYGNEVADPSNRAVLLQFNTVSNCKVFNCTLSNFTSYAILAQTTTSDGNPTAQEGLRVFQNKFTDQPYDSAEPKQAAIYFGEDAEYNNVHNNDFYRVVCAARFVDGANSSFENNMILDCTGDNTTLHTDRAVIYATHTSENSFKLKISNNRINHNETKKYVIIIDGTGRNNMPASGSVTVADDPCMISSNYMMSNGESSGVSNLVYVKDAPGTIFKDNIIRSRNNSSGYEVEFVNSDYISVTGNVFVGTSSAYSQDGFHFDNCKNITYSVNNTNYPYSGSYVLSNDSNIISNNIPALKQKTVLDVALYNTGDQLKNVKVNGQLIELSNALNVTESSGVITSQGSGAWNTSGFSAKNIMSEGEDCSAEYEVVQTDGFVMFGISYEDVDYNFTTIKWGIYARNNANLYPITDGVQGGSIGSYSVGDILKIQIKGDTAYLLKNGVILYELSLKVGLV